MALGLKLRQILAIGLLALSGWLAGCWRQPGIDLATLNQPRTLLQAQEISVDHFVSLRMSNRPRKALVGQWLILHEDEAFVYLGYPYFAGLFDDRRETESLYKVSRYQLQKRFPAYTKLDGNQVRSRVRAALEQQLEAEEQQQLGMNWPVSLTAEGLLFKVHLPKRSWQVLLDAESLELKQLVKAASSLPEHSPELPPETNP